LSDPHWDLEIVDSCPGGESRESSDTVPVVTGLEAREMEEREETEISDPLCTTNVGKSLGKKNLDAISACHS
jgi:hypothetical protein